MAEFRMPSLGADMEAGTLVQWLVKPGDTVKRGDLVAEVETQKGVIDVEIFEAGTVTEILVPEGAHVPVGTPLAVITAPGATTAPQPAAPEPVPAPMPEPALVAAVPVTARVAVAAVPVTEAIPAVANGHQRVRATPVARRRAAELGIDLAEVTGTGPGEAVVLIDVERAAKANAPAAVPSVAPAVPPVVTSATDAAAAMRAAIAVAMARSKREIPHYYLGSEIDMRRALDWLVEENVRRPVTERLLPAAMLLKAVALACREVPEMNGFWQDGAFQPSAAVHAGVAIALRGGGLVNPAIHDADRLSLTELMAALRDLVGRARGGKLRASELSDATITVTNLGDQGVGSVFGVIYPPQVALVGFGKVIERPWAVDGLIGVRPIVTATLSADHRASVGHRGAVFLAKIDALLQEPEHLS
jgi:pyruvate dehydrogenase E2 component (dihydrolipoamide acetyltransferase)